MPYRRDRSRLTSLPPRWFGTGNLSVCANRKGSLQVFECGPQTQFRPLLSSSPASIEWFICGRLCQAFRDEGVSKRASNATERRKCKTTAGQRRKPCVVALMPTHVNSTTTPTLNERSPSTVRGCGSASFEGEQAMPSAKRPIPTQRASGQPILSGLAPKTNKQGMLGQKIKMTPTIISAKRPPSKHNLRKF